MKLQRISENMLDKKFVDRVNNLGSQLAETTHNVEEVAVSITSFGASEESEDNWNAIQSALDYCMTHKKNLYIPNGEFISSPMIKALYINFDFKIFGEGKIICKDRSMSTDHEMLFHLRNEPGKVVTITINGVTIDMNARNNPLPDGSSAYAWEHNHAFFIRPRGEGEINVNVNNVHIIDPVADGINFSGVDRESFGYININGVTSEGRTRTRSDICITANFSVANIVNIDVDKLEVEINNPIYPPVFNVLNFNIKQMLDIHLGSELSQGKITNGSVTQQAFFWQYGGSVENVNFSLDRQFRLAHSDVSFINCNFTAKNWGDDYRMVYMVGNNTDSNAKFSNCTFNYIGDSYPEYYFRKDHSGTNDKKVTFDNCEFLGENVKAAYFRSGQISFTNCRFHGKGVNIKQFITDGLDLEGNPIINKVELYDNVLLNDEGYLYEPPYEGNVVNIYMKGNKGPFGKLIFLTRVDKANGNPQVFHSLDEQQSSEPPSEGYWLRGTRVVNDLSLDSSVDKWVCTASGNPGTWGIVGNIE